MKRSFEEMSQNEKNGENNENKNAIQKSIEKDNNELRNRMKKFSNWVLLDSDSKHFALDIEGKFKSKESFDLLIELLQEKKAQGSNNNSKSSSESHLVSLGLANSDFNVEQSKAFYVALLENNSLEKLYIYANCFDSFDSMKSIDEAVLKSNDRRKKNQIAPIQYFPCTVCN